MVENIVRYIDEEIQRLEQIKRMLQEGAAGGSRRGRPRGAEIAPATETRKPRQLSAKARKAIADGQRRRWAAQRAARPGSGSE